MGMVFLLNKERMSQNQSVNTYPCQEEGGLEKSDTHWADREKEESSAYHILSI